MKDTKAQHTDMLLRHPVAYIKSIKLGEGWSNISQQKEAV